MTQESPPQRQLQAPANVPVQDALDGESEQLQQEPNQTAQPGVLFGNLGEPIRLKGVNLAGVSAGPAEDSTQVKIWTRLALTSDDRLFHKVVENLGSAITHLAMQAGTAVNLGRADTVLLVVRPDEKAELWVDTAAMALEIMVKRNVQAGSAIFERDIADVTGMTFPLVDIGPKDRVLCLFRQDWRFALFFDFGRDRDLELASLTRTLGTLYRTLKYRHLYDVLADEVVFDRLIAAGWFPFVEIIGDEFRDLASSCEAETDLARVEEALVARFERQRLDRMLARWSSKPHLASRMPILQSAVNSFETGDPIATIKTILTEIEGVLAQAYRSVHGTGAKIKKLLEFATSSAEQKAGGSDTLLCPVAFARYLKAYTFADFDPDGPMGTAGSRHAVGHGAADAASYTPARALQALLTLDQIAFYT